MTSPADIFAKALERLSATTLSDEVEDINLGGTMLQAANAKSFKQIEAEANEEARRIVRGEPCRILPRERSGAGLSDEVVPRCSCGWRGRPESESDDFMSIKLALQERQHRGMA